MMPWEHGFAGYIIYSLFLHAVYRESPTSEEAVVVVLGSLLPDLVDKPLAWGFNVFSSGYAIGHSTFFALPASIAVVWLTSSRGRSRIGWAFAVGYLLHLVADLATEYFLDGNLALELILWPIRSDGGEGDTSFSEEFTGNVVEYVHWVSRQAASDDPDPYLFVILGIGIFGVLLWVYDGMPVGREAFYAVRRAVRAVARFVKG